MKRRVFLRSLTAVPMIGIPTVYSDDSAFPGGKRFAVTFSIDDGFWKSTQEFMRLFDPYGFKATFNLVTDWITPKQSGVGDEYNRDASHGTWTNWKTVLKQGHEIGSHSMTHPHLPKLSGEEIKRELLYSKRRIKEELKLWGPKTFAFPYNDTSPEVQKILGRYYLAARVGTQTGEINEPGKIDFLQIRSWWPLSPAPLEEIVAKIDRAREMRGWLVIGLHGMNGEGWNPITTEKMSGVLAHLAKQKDVYVDTFKKVAMWLKKNGR